MKRHVGYCIAGPLKITMDDGKITTIESGAFPRYHLHLLCATSQPHPHPRRPPAGMAYHIEPGHDFEAVEDVVFVEFEEISVVP